MANQLIGSLPSSFLVATFAHCLFTPRNRLQKYVFFRYRLSPKSQNYLYHRCPRLQIRTEK